MSKEIPKSDPSLLKDEKTPSLDNNIQIFQQACRIKITELKERHQKDKKHPEYYSDYYGSAPGTKNQFKEDILGIYKHAVEQVKLLSTFSKKSIRFAREETGLGITYHLIKKPDGSIVLGFDPNSKYFHNSLLSRMGSSPKVKFLGKGGQSTVRKGFALVSDQIIPTAVLVGSPDDKETLKLVLTINSPFILEYWIGSRYRRKKIGNKINKQKETNKFVQICHLMDSDLSKYLKECQKPEDLPLSHVLWMIYSLITGIKDLHNQGILHRDIKEKNILIKKSADNHPPIIKVADLGMVCKDDDEKNKNYRAGTYENFGFDNPHFKDLVDYFKKYRQYENEKISAEDFVYVVNNFKYSSGGGIHKPIIRNKIQWLSQIPAINILWEKIQRNESIEFDQCFGRKQEDMFQLLLVCLEVLKKFRELNSDKGINEKINIKINKLYSRIEKHLRLNRAQRYTAEQFQDFFIRTLQDIVKIDHPEANQCKSHFAGMSENLKVKNPLESQVNFDKESKMETQPKKIETYEEEKKDETTQEKSAKNIPSRVDIDQIFENLKTLINSDFWLYKTFGGRPTGVREMKVYLSRKPKDESLQTTFRILRQIAIKRLKKNKNRDNDVIKFYNLLKKSTHITDLINTKDWNDLITASSGALSALTNSEKKALQVQSNVEVDNPLAEFVAVLFDDYWSDKTTFGLGVPDGIRQMREYYKQGNNDLEKFSFLAGERSKRQPSFFGIKGERNPLVSEFYKILCKECKECKDIASLVKTPVFKNFNRALKRQSFLDVLFNNFWDGKSRLKLNFLPDGINRMRTLYHFNAKECDLDKFFEDCKLQAQQIPIFQNSFLCKVNPIVAQFYRKVKNCPNLDVFVNSPYFRDLRELQRKENENNNSDILVRAKLSSY